jgi:hypothetical protein
LRVRCLPMQGVVVFWGLTEKQERDVIRNIVTPCLVDPLPQVRCGATGSSARLPSRCFCWLPAMW